MAEFKEFEGFLKLVKGFSALLFLVQSLENFQNLKIIPFFSWY